MSNPELTPTRLARVRILFDGALEHEPGERRAFLERACGDDRSLISEVESLLEALERGNDTWESPVGALLPEALAAGTVDESGLVGERIGPYEIVRLIGVGGMGAVYECARADEQFRKRVAIKFLRPGLEGDLAVRRFRYERQILANLSHPNIASLLDGGVTADGQPYFVMEYVDGKPITEWCAGKAIDVRSRVMLLRQVCEAVQHAHQHLVVHRDLKPGNILVDAEGTVKLLDFGIARLLREAEGSDQLPVTQGGVFAFTPDYASPEQVRGLAVATATDIYSLGVICAEVLSGHRPYVLKGKLFSEMQDIICQTPAARPSSLVTDADAPRFGERSAERIRMRLSGDLDAVVLHALRKEPERRYGSVEKLNDDLRRYLEGLPVSAQRDRLAYRVGKFVRRRRVEVAAATLMFVSLVGGMVVSRRQMRRAELERAKMEEVNGFLANMLSAADPEIEGRDVTVVQAMSRAASQIEQSELDPEVEAQIRHTLAQTYVGLGLPDSAAGHAHRAWELRREVLGERNQLTNYSLSYVIAILEARGSYAEAESLSRVHVALQREMPGHDPGEMATALDNLSRIITHQGRLDDAMAVQLEAIEFRKRGTDSTSMAALPFTLSNLAVGYSYKGEFAKAESLGREALAAEERVHGTSTVTYGNLLRGLSSTLESLKRLPESDSVARQSLEVLRAAVGESHPNYIASVTLLAWIRYAMNDMPGTVAAAREVVRSIGTALHESESNAASTLQVLGLALDSLGEHAAADSALRRSLAIRLKYLPPDHWAIASSESVLGGHLTQMGQYAAAEPMLRQAYEKLAAARGPDSAPAISAARRMADLLAEMGRTDDAEEWRAKQ